MKSKKLRCLAAFALAAPSANAAVITDFSTFTESGTLTVSPNLLQQSITTTTGVGTNSVIGTANGGSGAAGQDVYLSDSFSLATVGSRISASLGSFAGTASTSQAVGLAVASSETLTSRVNLTLFYFRRDANNELGYVSFDGSGASLPSVNTNIGGGSLVFPDSIYIERTLTGYILGSITGVTSTVRHTLTIGSGNVSANGSAVGIYSDVRSSNNVNTLTNFSHIPEPSTALLGGLGMLALLRRRR